MKREDVKNKIPGITDEQLNWIMQENGADINREKSAATALQNSENAQFTSGVSFHLNHVFFNVAENHKRHQPHQKNEA